MHKLTGERDPAASFALPVVADDAKERRLANKAIGLSALGLAVTGLIELALAILSGSVGLLGDALHNLSDVSTSLLVFIGFKMSKRPASERYSYGYERAEDLAGIGIAIVIWISAAAAGLQSVHKLLEHGTTEHVGWAMGGAVIGIVGNQVVARYKGIVGARINSGTLIADAKHSWLDALSSAGALIGLLAVLLGVGWADAVAGLVVTAFICHVGWEVTSDIATRLLDGVDPAIITAVELIAGDVPGVVHAHARARWTGRTLRVEIEGWVDAALSVANADAIGRDVAQHVSTRLPDIRSITWAARPV
jgi:cation diffusion facilitator family transporter